VRWYLSSLEELEGLARDFEAVLHPAREDYDFGAMIEQFLHVCLLNAGHMISPCLAPVPFSRSTRKKLCILVRLGSPFHLKPSPGDVFDSRRTVFGFHNNNIVRQPSGSFQCSSVARSAFIKVSNDNAPTCKAHQEARRDNPPVLCLVSLA
jgi:hypothetical protein